MSCICQYFVDSSEHNPSITQKEVQPETSGAKAICSTSRSNVSATDLAAASAEIWILRKSLTDARISIENLESLVKTLIDKQHAMLVEMYHLKQKNFEMQDECRLQRDYQTMERNALLRELHGIKHLLRFRSKELKTALAKNTELLNAVEDAKEKIYLTGMKYLRLKQMKTGHFSTQSESEQSSEESEGETSEQSEESGD